MVAEKEEEMTKERERESEKARRRLRARESRGLGRRIHGSVEDTKLSTNKQHSLSSEREGEGERERVCVREMKDMHKDREFAKNSKHQYFHQKNE